MRSRHRGLTKRQGQLGPEPKSQFGTDVADGEMGVSVQPTLLGAELELAV
jgi:hypothetical protein